MEGKIIKSNYRPKKVRVRDKGQFTIPSEIREKIGIKEDSVLEVYQFGRVIVAIPEKLVLRELAQGVKDRSNE